MNSETADQKTKYWAIYDDDEAEEEVNTEAQEEDEYDKEINELIQVIKEHAKPDELGCHCHLEKDQSTKKQIFRIHFETFEGFEFALRQNGKNLNNHLLEVSYVKGRDLQEIIRISNNNRKEARRDERGGDRRGDRRGERGDERRGDRGDERGDDRKRRGRNNDDHDGRGGHKFHNRRDGGRDDHMGQGMRPRRDDYNGFRQKEKPTPKKSGSFQPAGPPNAYGKPMRPMLLKKNTAKPIETRNRFAGIASDEDSD